MYLTSLKAYSVIEDFEFGINARRTSLKVRSSYCSSITDLHTVINRHETEAEQLANPRDDSERSVTADAIGPIATR
jgi:hypothetical protein